MTTAILCLFEDILFDLVVEAKHFPFWFFSPRRLFSAAADGIRR